MKLVEKTQLLLTEEEKQTLKTASAILDEIATKMDRAVSVSWSAYDDDDLWYACEIMNSLIQEEN